MDNQEAKQRILNKLRNIVFLLLGITVLFLSIESIAQAKGNLGGILGNVVWLLLSLIVLVQAVISIIRELKELPSKQRLYQLSDWAILISGIILGNAGYFAKQNSLLLIGVVLIISGCNPKQYKTKNKYQIVNIF